MSADSSQASDAQNAVDTSPSKESIDEKKESASSAGTEAATLTESTVVTSDPLSDVSKAKEEESESTETTKMTSVETNPDLEKAKAKAAAAVAAALAAYPSKSKGKNEALVTVNPANGERTVIPEETKRIETLKQAGNELFSGEKFLESMQLYTEAIGLLREALSMKEDDSFDEEMAKTLSKPTKRLASVLLSNRANSFIQLGMPLQSLDDAEQALDIDPTYPKAYFRRGNALLSLNRGEEAMQDFRKAAVLCPKDPIALQKARECENFVKMQARERNADMADQLARRKAVERFSKLVNVSGSELGPPDPAKYRESVLSAVPTVKELEQMIDGFKRGKRVHAHYIAQMLFKVLGILKALPNVVTINLEPGEHITVVGDIHGQFYDLLHVFEMNGMPSETNPYLFNGDFVDRGAWSVECILTLLTLKCMYPNHVHLARGNHETVNMNRTYGFSQEACEKYGNSIEILISEVFCALPIAHVLGGKVFVVHGGLSAKTPRDVVGIDAIQAIDRFCQPPDNSVMSDLLWSDPQEPRGVAMSPRGIGCLFGPDVTAAFLERNKLELVVRSHESVMTGYHLHQQGKLITVFSAPNYCDTLGNVAAIVKFTAPEMKPVFVTYKASPHPSVSQRFDLLSLFRF